MNLYRLKKLLWAASAGLVLGAVLTIAGAAWWPYHTSEPVESSPTVVAAAANESHGLPPLEAFAPLWDRDFQQPLFDGPQASQDAPAFPATLTGTIVEPGFSRAMFRLESGATEMRGVGTTVAGAEVLEIAGDGAVVLYQGQRLTLKPSPKAGPGGVQP
jgi:hypothetical protein